MKQYEAVIKVMEENGGFATLGFLNQNVDVSKWVTKTPFASIRRIVQDERFFLNIKPGLWALKSYSNKLPEDIIALKKGKIIKETEELNHSYYQGLLVDIGNIKKYSTFIPNQDKNKKYLGKKLSEIISMSSFFRFSYEEFINRARTVDVSWFNIRRMPSFFFEIEHKTDIQNSLLKFVDLQDFNVEFIIVANEKRKLEFDKKVNFTAFESIKDRVKFLNYEKLSYWHSKSFEIYSIENYLNA
jgi:hypothetical protein